MINQFPYKYIVVEGNIGAGKTSFATMVSHQFGGKLVLEQFADNPFLPKFYQNQERYAFSLELSFLAARYRQLHAEVTDADLFKAFTIADYFFSKSMVFARTTLSGDEFVLYRQLFDIILQQVPTPDLYLYLHSTPDRLMKNIQQRGRDYEQSIDAAYLKAIQDSYFEYFKSITQFPVVVVECTTLDFVNNNSHFEKMVDLLLGHTFNQGLQIVSL